MTASSDPLEAAFATERRFLWGLCYRLTGCAADADDLVQETFVRALERRGLARRGPVRPWLARIATNLGIDLLRRRRRAPYPGQWLPSPIDADCNDVAGTIGARETTDPDQPEARYGLLESVSFAFLLALEALTPKQRAVLVLCDVFDFSSAEAAAALEMSDASVRTTLHRARRRMRDYDTSRTWRARAAPERTAGVLERFVGLLQAHDVDGVVGMLAADVRATSDGGGEFSAAVRPFVGAEAVAKLYLNLSAANAGRLRRMSVLTLNGTPALVMDLVARPPAIPPRAVILIDLDDRGLVAAIHSVSATRKLTHIGSRASGFG